MLKKILITAAVILILFTSIGVAFIKIPTDKFCCNMPVVRYRLGIWIGENSTEGNYWKQIDGGVLTYLGLKKIKCLCDDMDTPDTMGKQDLADTLAKKPDTTVAKVITALANTDCSAESILKLKDDQNISQSFFAQIKKWEVKNGTVNKEGENIFATITPTLLKDFLRDLNLSKLKTDDGYTKICELNIAPKEYPSKEKCQDQIRLTFIPKTCVFNLSVNNSFYVDEFGCSEHSTNYTFKFVDNNIALINILIAG